MLPSKSSSDHDTKIYELRTYYVKPKAFGKRTTILTTKNYLWGLTEARVKYLSLGKYPLLEGKRWGVQKLPLPRGIIKLCTPQRDGDDLHV